MYGFTNGMNRFQMFACTRCTLSTRNLGLNESFFQTACPDPHHPDPDSPPLVTWFKVEATFAKL